MAESYDVIVIGAGLGGLTAAALLARAGRKTLVVERNASVGGAASTYKVGDLVVEASLHETSDPRDPIDPKHSILARIGVLDAVEWVPTVMQMMQKMHSGAMPRMAMMGASLMTPGGAIQNVEGHIAFLKAELKITDAQQKQWDQFAYALRTNATALSAAYSGMMSGRMGGVDKKMPPMARLELQEKLQTLQLEALKRSRTALDGLNAVLSDEQKQRLDQLI
jgi:phytoene dehydrogenase-like protein